MTDGLSAFSLAGRTALVTGAGQGIGRTLALGLAGVGARVAVTDVNPDTTARVADEVRALKVDVAHRVLDVARVEDIEGAVTWAEREVGPIDILVNNAGVREPTFDSLALTVADWDHILDVNLRGPFFLCQAVGRRLAERGGGSIINIASQLGMVGMAGRPAYTASKAGLINLTRTLALEWAPRRIRVNAIAPGPIHTPFTERISRDAAARARYQEATPLGAWPEPEELVGAVVYLASDASRWVTGHTLVVDGGFTARQAAAPYDVTREAVQVLAIVTKAEAARWLAEHGTPGASGGPG